MLDQRIFSEKGYLQRTDDWQPEAVTLPNYREAAYALLRLTVGVVFLFSGITKLMGGLGNFASHMEQQFVGKLPSILVIPFAFALPFAEVVIGALLILGLFNLFALMLAGLLMVALTFGTVMEGDFPTVAHNVMYALVVFVLIWLSEYNRYSFDRLLLKRQIKD
jgi:thiosulfate dehydrogenase (quinone) large subunit